jgi:HSP20 family molecular chaperone IbpA
MSDRNDVSRLLEFMMGTSGLSNLSSLSSIPTGPRRTPSVRSIPYDMFSDEKTIYIYAEIPGVEKENIDVDFYNNKITIKVEKNRPYEPPQNSQIVYGKFENEITLPLCITKRETVSVSCNNGILKIKINKFVEEENKFSIKPE